MSKKKTYRKPAIKQVKLVPEEAMIQGCKTGANGPKSVKCTSGGGCSADELGT